MFEVKHGMRLRKLTRHLVMGLVRNFIFTSYHQVVAQGGGWKSVLTGLQASGGAFDGQGRLLGMLKSAAGGVSNGGAGLQDVVRLLRG